MQLKEIIINRKKSINDTPNNFEGEIIFVKDNEKILNLDLNDMAKEFSKMILPKLIDEIVVKDQFDNVTQTINILDQNNNSSPQVIKTTFFKIYRSDGTSYTVTINDVDTIQDLSKFEINKETNLNAQKTDILKWFDDFVADVSPNYIKFKARICEEIKNGNRD